MRYGNEPDKLDPFKINNLNIEEANVPVAAK